MISSSSQSCVNGFRGSKLYVCNSCRLYFLNVFSIFSIHYNFPYIRCVISKTVGKSKKNFSRWFLNAVQKQIVVIFQLLCVLYQYLIKEVIFSPKMLKILYDIYGLNCTRYSYNWNTSKKNLENIKNTIFFFFYYLLICQISLLFSYKNDN